MGNRQNNNNNNNNNNNMEEATTSDQSNDTPTTIYVPIPNTNGNASVESILLTRNGKRLFLLISRGFNDAEIVVWDAIQTQIDFIIPAVNPTFGNRAGTIVAPCDDLLVTMYREFIHVWDIERQCLRKEIRMLGPWTGICEISSSSTFVLVGGFHSNTVVKLYDITTTTGGDAVCEIELPQEQQQRSNFTLNLCISRSGNTFAVATDRLVHVFTLQHGQATLTSTFSHSLAQAPGGFWFSYNNHTTEDRLIIRNVRSSIVQVFRLDGHKVWDLDHENTLVTTQTQRTPFQHGLLTADVYCNVHLWDLSTGRKVFSFGLSLLPSARAARRISDLYISQDLNQGVFVIGNKYCSFDLAGRLLYNSRAAMREFIKATIMIVPGRMNLDVLSRIASYLAEVKVVMTETAIANGSLFTPVLETM